MKVYSFDPQPCVNKEGVTFRPFHIDGKEVYLMDIAVMLGTDKEAADKEMLMLCEVIRENTGAIISPGELPAVMKSRKIIVE